MDMKGEYRIALPQALVWRALNDSEILKAAIPGCEELIRDSDTHFKGRIAAAVGPVRAKFGGEATLSEIDPPNGYTLSASGSGGAAGMAKGSATVRLTTEPDGTLLTYEAHAQVAGKLAQIGSRLIDMAAKKMADEFFGNFVRLLEPIAEAEAQPASPPVETLPIDALPIKTLGVETPPESMPAGPVAAEKNSQARFLWLVCGAIVVIAVLAFAFFR